MFIGIQCVPSGESPFYTCLGCPAGSSGNGTYCRDIDEVSKTDISTNCQLTPSFSESGM